MRPRRAARLFDMPSNFGWDAAGRLAEAAAAGDREALAGLIRATQRDVWRFVASQAGTVDADDLTQETYLRAIGALPRFEGRSSIRTWLLVIARRVVTITIGIAPPAPGPLRSPIGAFRPSARSTTAPTGRRDSRR
jgi:hypothetical protein